jgi:leader peptidase (prepilin peptidase)/N-methyltransferase
VFGWLFQRGNHACCANPIPVRAPLTSALVLAVAIVLALTLPSGARPFASAASELAVLALIAAAALIDLEEHVFPDGAVLPAIVGAVGAHWLAGGSIAGALLGLAVGVGIVALPFILAPRLRGEPDSMGWGDAKVIGAGGALFGWPGAVTMLIGMAALGLLWVAIRTLLGLRTTPPLPPAVAREQEELRRAADAGDEEAELALRARPREPVATGPFYLVVLVALAAAQACGATWSMVGSRL